VGIVAQTAVDRGPQETWPDLGRIRGKIIAAGRLFLFLDFDGTLAPIVSLPSLAAIPQDVRAALGDLAANTAVVTAIVSGRAVDDLQRRVGLPVVYAGDHGLEIRGAGLHFTLEAAQRLRPELLAVCNEVRGGLEKFTGALVECKRLTASVHVRQVARQDLPAVAGVLQRALERRPGFQLRQGNEVFEIRPDVAWNKGSAARWILEQNGGSGSNVICIGDDSTDEDMFAEFKDGATIRVGLDGWSSAQYRLRQTDVLRFLSFVRDVACGTEQSVFDGCEVTHGGNGQ